MVYEFSSIDMTSKRKINKETEIKVPSEDVYKVRMYAGPGFYRDKLPIQNLEQMKNQMENLATNLSSLGLSLKSKTKP